MIHPAQLTRAVVLAGVLSIASHTTAFAADPRPAGQRPTVSSVEGGMWGLFDDAEQQAKLRADLNRSPELNAYVSDLVCRLARDYCPDIRVYVMDRPFFNASMAANGYMEVWSGAMLRAEDEAELAFVLGHEIGHFAENHSLEIYNRQKVTSTALMVVSFGAAAAGAYYGVDVSDLIDMAYMANVAGYYSHSRESEFEADSIGLNLLADAGYAPGAAQTVWATVSEESQSSTFESVRRRDAMASAFRTHPLTRQRIAALAEQAEALPDTGRRERERYRAIIRPHLSKWLAQERQRRDFDGQLYLADRLARDGEDLGVINHHRGELYRTRRASGDSELALAAYLEASRHADAPATVWRELGDLYARSGQTNEARNAYQVYLERVPEADDAWIIEDSLKALGTPQ